MLLRDQLEYMGVKDSQYMQTRDAGVGDAVADRVKVTKQDSDKRGRIGIVKEYKGDKPLVKFPDGDEVLFDVGDLEKQGSNDSDSELYDYFSTSDAPDYYGAIVAIARRADNPKASREYVKANLAPVMKVQGVKFDEAEFEKSYKQFSNARMGREYEKSRDTGEAKTIKRGGDWNDLVKVGEQLTLGGSGEKGTWTIKSIKYNEADGESTIVLADKVNHLGIR